MDDPVAITPERVAGRTWALDAQPPPAFARIGGVIGTLTAGFDHHLYDSRQLTPWSGALNYRARQRTSDERQRHSQRTGGPADRRDPQSRADGNHARSEER